MWSRKQQWSLCFFLPRTRVIVTPTCDPALGGNRSRGLRLTDKFSAPGQLSLARTKPKHGQSAKPAAVSSSASNCIFISSEEHICTYLAQVMCEY